MSYWQLIRDKWNELTPIQRDLVVIVGLAVAVMGVAAVGSIAL